VTTPTDATTAPGASRGPERRVAQIVLAVGSVAAGLLAALLVPWHPVPGGAPPAALAEDWFTTAELVRAEEFAASARAWSWSSLAVSMAVVVVLGFTRLGARLVSRLRGPWPLRVVTAVVVVLLAGRVLTLPFAVGLRDHLRDYGLSTQSWAGFARDLVVSELVSVVTTSLAVLVIVALARRWPRAWPALVGGALAALVLLGSFVYPLLVEPLFNRFEPLPDGQLRSAVLELAEREGVEIDQVLVADASRRTTALNAYVSGFGGSRRVVLYDTTVETLPPGQTLSIVAHELAHARHDDVLVGTAIGAAGAVAAAGALALLVPRRPRRRDGAGVAHPEAVPRILALVAVATLLVSPVQNGLSRLVETRADVDALTATQDPQSFTEMQVRLALRSIADPTPPTWSHYWFASHPTVLERLALAAPSAASASWSAGPRSRTATSRRGTAVLDLGLGVSEDACDEVAEKEDDGDDQGGDAGDQQAVLHGRGAALVHLGLLTQDHDADEVDHCVSPSDWFPRQWRAGDRSLPMAPV
jgi:STE24 endopeptidase